MREVMLGLHFVGLAMGLGTGFAHAFLGAAAKKMSPEEGTKFKLQSLAVSMMGHIGLALLLVSGFYLITPFWKQLPGMPWLIVKLSLVAILIVLIGMISVAGKKAKQGDTAKHLKKAEALGKLTLIVALAIVASAVAVFR